MSASQRPAGSTAPASRHQRQQSSGGGFGDFVDATSPHQPSPSAFSNLDGQAAESSSAFSSSFGDSSDWQIGDTVASFSPIEPVRMATQQQSHTSQGGKIPTSTAATTEDLLDWDAWDSHTPIGKGSTTPGGVARALAATGQGAARGSSGLSSEDEAFFRQFEQAAMLQQHNRPPSPPIIDLRAVERKLEAARAKSQALPTLKPPTMAAPPTADEDFFAAFERSPRETMSRRGTTSPGLVGDQLDSIGEAQSTPLDMPPRSGDANRAGRDYFGADEGSGRSDSKPESLSPSQSWTEAAGGWAGSLRKAVGTLRSMPAELASHLPSASDFVVPAAQANEEDGGAGRSPTAWMGLTTRPLETDERQQQQQHSNGSKAKTSSSPTSHSPMTRIARASDYAHGTPFGPSSSASGSGSSWTGMDGGAGSSSGVPQSRIQQMLRNSTAPSIGPAPISGAPGFDSTTTKRWNTGDWHLDAASEAERTRKPMPVNMVGRRAETEEVLEEWHASRLQAALPPRLQLGKTWRLLYSIDQHGTSLLSLYDRVRTGLDSGSIGTRSVSGGGASAGEDLTTDAEGWMRGASSAAQAAMGISGSRIRGVGGGLAIQDAGIIVAVRDTEDNVFGAFVNERLRPQSHYYGNGECFLWKTASAPHSDPDRSKRISTFRWTGRNDYMVLTEAHYLSFGGGDGRYGLWLDAKMEKGVSARCPAFNNDVLCDAGEQRARPKVEMDEERKFECLGLEVWAVGID